MGGFFWAPFFLVLFFVVGWLVSAEAVPLLHAVARKWLVSVGTVPLFLQAVARKMAGFG